MIEACNPDRRYNVTELAHLDLIMRMNTRYNFEGHITVQADLAIRFAREWQLGDGAVGDAAEHFNRCRINAQII